MGLPIYTVDAFADRPFTGNPAAVCLLPEPTDDTWLQKVAREMNLSETAFLHPENDGWRLRWFTPAVEVALCGHATLAAAHILWETGREPAAHPLRFHTRSGLLCASRHQRLIELDFPAKPAQPAPPPPGLAEALGATPRCVARSDFDYLVEVDHPDALLALRPDFRKLAGLPVRGVIVTARSARREFDFISRFFAPAVGVDEDPVTGSAHCTLGPYWSDRLKKTTFNAFQASTRGGVLRVRLKGNRVLLGGRARTILRGELL